MSRRKAEPAEQTNYAFDPENTPHLVQIHEDQRIENPATPVAEPVGEVYIDENGERVEVRAAAAPAAE